MKTYLYPKSIYSTTLAFCDLFDNMVVKNYMSDSSVRNIIQVPVTLDPKEKIEYYLTDEGVKTLKPAERGHFLPRMSITMGAIEMDRARKMGSLALKREVKVIYSDDTGQVTELTTDLIPCAIIIPYTLHIWAKEFDHGIQLLENILPFFDSHVDIWVKERGFKIRRKEQVTMEDSTTDFTYEMGTAIKRTLRWDLGFNVTSQLYKPVEIAGDIIKNIYVDYLDATREDADEFDTQEGERQRIYLNDAEDEIIREIQSRLIKDNETGTKSIVG